mgnify:CR=1 FL=1
MVCRSKRYTGSTNKHYVKMRLIKKEKSQPHESDKHRNPDKAS